MPTGVRIRISLDRATEELLANLKSAADAAPGPGKVMIFLEKKGEFQVILEPEEYERGSGSVLGRARRRIDGEGNGAAAWLSWSEKGFPESGR